MGMKNAWEMEFAHGSAEGLEQIEKSNFDIVFADLNMPGMGGIDFLKALQTRCPLALRVIFSSYADKQSILDCAGLVHQFLPKPFDRESLISTIERAKMIASIPPDSSIRQRISELEGIPSVPKLYQELVNHLRSSNNSVDDIGNIVSQDIGMTLQILKLVNSAYFGLPEPTSNVTRAIAHLGVETVKYLALAVGVFSQFESKKLGGISLDVLWHHSTRTAATSKSIASMETRDRRIIEDAAAAGLLHDVGKLVLASNYPDRYETVGRLSYLKQIEWIIEERNVFGFDHAEVGRYLMALWGLPAPIVDAVGFHHYPTKSEQSNFTALTAVHAANHLVQTRRQTRGGVAPPQIDHLYLAKTCNPNSLERWREELSRPPPA